MLQFIKNKVKLKLIDNHAIINQSNVKKEFERLNGHSYFSSFEKFFDRLEFDWSNDISQDDWNGYIDDYDEGWSTTEQYKNNEMFFMDGEVWCSMECLDNWYCSSDTSDDDKLVYSIAWDIINQFHQLHGIIAVS